MTQRIVFHIGLTKTGTTSLQYFCARHAAALRRRGVLYPRSQRGLARNHAPLVSSYLADRALDPTIAIRPTSRAKAVAATIREITASGALVTLISAEHFADHFDQAKIAELAADFAAFDLRVVVALRDHLARFVSSYVTHITAGGCLSLADYADSILVPNTRFMSVEQTLRAWQAVVGMERVALVDYDAETDIVGAVLRHCGLSDGLADLARPWARSSPGRDTIEAVRVANSAIRARQTVALEASTGAWLQLSVFSILCRRRIAAALRDRAQRPWAITSALAERIDMLARSDRQWLRDTYGFDLRGAPEREIDIAPDDGGLSDADERRALRIVEDVTRFLWAPSEVFVRLWDRFGARRAV